MQIVSTLPQLLHGFFQDWLIQQRSISSHTVISYRDTWRLLLRFVAAQRQRAVAKITALDRNSGSTASQAAFSRTTDSDFVAAI